MNNEIPIYIKAIYCWTLKHKKINYLWHNWNMPKDMDVDNLRDIGLSALFRMIRL